MGFGAVGEMVQLENRDGGGEGDSLRFYVAITLPQMPLSEIDGMINLFSTQRAKERHLIFRCVLAGLLGAVRNQIFRLADRPVCSVETKILGSISWCLFGCFII
jgi:hypothetical protein